MQTFAEGSAATKRLKNTGLETSNRSIECNDYDHAVYRNAPKSYVRKNI